MGGDFNFVTDIADPAGSSQPDKVAGPDRSTKDFGEVFAAQVELRQLCFARKKRGHGRVSLLSRLDLCCWRVLGDEALERRFDLFRVEDVAGPTLSDHALVSLRLGQRPTGVAPIPRWGMQNPCFGELLREGIDRLLPHGLGVLKELRAVVSVKQFAARQLRAESSVRGARTDEERIHWILVGMRAWRDGGSVQRALRDALRMSSAVGVLDMPKSHALLASLAEHSLGGDGSESGGVASSEVVEKRRFWRSRGDVNSPLRILKPVGTSAEAPL